MPPVDDTNVPHEQQVDDAVDAEMRRTSSVGVLANVGAASNPPTQAEVNALVTSHNSVLQVLRDAELIPTA